MYHNTCNLVENVLHYTSHQSISTSIMYDDYDLDYTYSNDYAQDLEDYARDADIDEEYTRDGQDYESLAYRHYA